MYKIDPFDAAFNAIQLTAYFDEPQRIYLATLIIEGALGMAEAESIEGRWMQFGDMGFDEAAEAVSKIIKEFLHSDDSHRRGAGYKLLRKRCREITESFMSEAV